MGCTPYFGDFLFIQSKLFDKKSKFLPLQSDDSMEKFKQGVELANVCNKKLEQAEKSITQLIENTDGTVTEEKFEI